MSTSLKELSRPNLPEITSTTMPLLSTVLAGFAVTIIATLLTQGNPSNIWPLPNPFWGLILLATSTPLLLTTAFFGIRAQAYSYLNLNIDVQRMLELKEPGYNINYYLEMIYNKWLLWYQAADLAFTLGLLAFVGGIDLLLWNYLGLVGALIFLLIIIFAIIWGIWLQSKEKKIS